MIREILKRKNKEFENEIFIECERENILNEETGFFVHEAYNKLRSNIKFSLSGKGTKIILVTSTNPSEGKSINALNIAVSYAEIGQKVIIIDCDMRKPKQHRLLDLPLSPGLSNILVSDAEPEKIIRHDEKLNIDIITAGEIPPNSTTLLEADEMTELLSFLTKYDIVVFDTPPVNSVIDSCILAQTISEFYEDKVEKDETKQKKSKKPVGVVFVVKQDYTKREQLISAVRQLEAADANIVGFVLNNIKDKNILASVKYRKYRSYEKYGYTNENSKTRRSSRQENVAAAVIRRIKNKKMKFKVRYAVVGVILICMISAGAAVHNNWDKIKMVYQGVTTDSADIASGLEENERKTGETLQKLSDKQFFALSNENRKQLASGTLSREDAIRLIKGLPLKTEETDNTDNTSSNRQTGSGKNQTDNEPEPQPEPEFTQQDEIIADIYLLQAEYLNEIDALITDGKKEYIAVNKENKGFSAKMDLIQSVTDRGNALEANCDARMDELLQRLEAELKQNGGDTGVIKEIQSLYKNEKELKKAQLVNMYYPK